LAEARGEIAYSAGFLEWFSEEARRIDGEVVSGATNSKQMVFIREPVGVAAMITPW
jgi:succinate-semialdehyde dehydrogenase/glutarate-semialdehyde dehydrogenase